MNARTPKEPDLTVGPPPPVGNRGAYDWPAVAKRAKDESPEWVGVFENDNHGLSVSIRQGNNSHLHPDKGFRITTRHNHDEGGTRKCALYVRYIPEYDTTLDNNGTNERSKR